MSYYGCSMVPTFIFNRACFSFTSGTYSFSNSRVLKFRGPFRWETKSTRVAAQGFGGEEFIYSKRRRPKAQCPNL